MVQALHKFTPSSPTGNGGVERCPQDQLRLLAGVLLTNVPHSIKFSGNALSPAHSS